MGNRDVRHNGHRLHRCDRDDDVRVLRFRHDFHYYHINQYHTASLDNIYLYYINYDQNDFYQCLNHHSFQSAAHYNDGYSDRHSASVHRNEHSDRNRTTVHSNQHRYPNHYEHGDADDFYHARLGVRSDGHPLSGWAGDRLRGQETTNQGELNYGEIDVSQAKRVPCRACDIAPRCRPGGVRRLADRQLRARPARPGNHDFDHYDPSGLDSVHKPVLGQLLRWPPELHNLRDDQSGPAIAR